jgi:hypothetical protein
VGSLAASRPGALWIIGNEPDRGPNPADMGRKDRNGNCFRGQDDTYPEVYAQVYHDAYALIKASDPTARVAVAGLVEVTPGRLQYLDKVWQAYQERYGIAMPVDAWTIHLYVLPEANPAGQPNGAASVALGSDVALAIRESGGSSAACADPGVYCVAEHDSLAAFEEQVVAMRSWMKRHGQQERPLILTEYSLLYPYWVDSNGCQLWDENGQCFTPDRVRTFMTRTFDYLDSAADPDLGYPVDENRLVQRWLWFGAFFSAVPQSAGHASNLLVDTQDALSPLGELYRSSVAGRSSTVNLRPDPIPARSARASAGAASTPISVSVYNAGTARTAGSFTVTFYSDSGLTRPIGSATVAAGLPGCEGSRVSATVVWPNLAAGLHPFWVRVDSGGAVAESSESDNVAAGAIRVFSHEIMAPLVLGS